MSIEEYTEVSLVGVTNPTIIGLTGPEDLVAYAARVSNPGNQMNTETAPKLLKYLIKNRHWSPFEMVHVVMEIVTTRDIARQILRHRSFSFQEFSQRYATADQLGFVTREARMQDAKNRQASHETDDRELQTIWEDKQLELLVKVKELYTWALTNGIAKEQSRSVLPEGMTKSRLYMSGTLRSWIHYILERRENGTQKEHRVVANKVQPIILDQFPSLEEFFNDSKSQ